MTIREVERPSFNPVDPISNRHNYTSNIDDDIQMAEALIKEIHQTTEWNELTVQDKLNIAQIHARLALAHAAKFSLEGAEMPWSS